MLAEPWLNKPWLQAKFLMDQGRFPHAVLLTGAEDLGKDQLASAIAQALLCYKPTPQGGCGVCQACHLLAAGHHPDRLYIESPGSIGVDQIRRVNERLTERPMQGRNQVVILLRAQDMTENAANALLKTLEEPSSNSFLILGCEVREQLLATLTSRCQIIHLKTPDEQVSLTWLQKQLNEPPSRTVLRLHQGVPVRALTYCRSGDQSWQTLPQGLLELRTDPAQALRLCDLLLKPSEHRIDWLIYLLQDLIKCLGNCPEQFWVWQSQSEVIRNIAKPLEIQHCLHQVRQLLNIKRLLGPSSLVNSRMQLLAWMCQFYQGV